MLTLELAGNTTGMSVASPMIAILIYKTTIAKPLDSRFSNEEKQEILTRTNTLLRQVKSYINNNFYPVKVNVIDLTKEKFSQPLKVKEFLDELESSKNDYYRALST